MRASIVRTGVANTASVRAAFERFGVTTNVTTDPGAVRDAELAVLPGVGSFGAGMRSLRESGMDAAITDRVRSGLPTLAICLGLQLLARESDESPGVRGLGVIDAAVTRFPDGVRTPQFGWNRVQPSAPGPVDTGHAYFANSYRMTTAPSGWDAAITDHGGPFVSAMWHGRVLACQFHPELSGQWGQRILERWALAEEVSSC